MIGHKWRRDGGILSGALTLLADEGHPPLPGGNPHLWSDRSLLRSSNLSSLSDSTFSVWKSRWALISGHDSSNTAGLSIVHIKVSKEMLSADISILVFARQGLPQLWESSVSCQRCFSGQVKWPMPLNRSLAICFCRLLPSAVMNHLNPSTS